MGHIPEGIHLEALVEVSDDDCSFTMRFDPPLVDGQIRLPWPVRARDPHPIEGRFSFTTSAPPSTPTPAVADTLASGTLHNASQAPAPSTTLIPYSLPMQPAVPQSEVNFGPDSRLFDGSLRTEACLASLVSCSKQLRYCFVTTRPTFWSALSAQRPATTWPSLGQI
jgi:hypothetical protein